MAMQSGLVELWMAGRHTETRQKTSVSSLGACVLSQKGENDLGFSPRLGSVSPGGQAP